MKNESTDIPKRPPKDDIYPLALVASNTTTRLWETEMEEREKRRKTENRDRFSLVREERRQKKKRICSN